MRLSLTAIFLWMLPKLVFSQNVPPEFPGGVKKYFAYKDANLKMPYNQTDIKISGTVYVEVMFNIDGSIDDSSVKIADPGHFEEINLKTPKILKNTDCEVQAIRFVKNMPDYSPGLIDGQPVRAKLILPIKFKIKPNGG